MKSVVSVFLAAALILSMTGCGVLNPFSNDTTSSKSYIYVGNFTDRTVEVFSVDAGTGAMTAVQSFALTTPPAAIAIQKSGKFLYYTDSLQVFALSIGSDGKLAAIGSPVNAGVGCTGLESSGSFVYAGCSGAIAAYKIGSDGTITAASGSPFSFAGGTASMSLDPTGHTLYVIGSGSAVNGYLKTFVLNTTTGAVAAGSGDKTFVGLLTGSAIDASGKNLYLVTSTTLGGPASDALNQYAIQSDASLTPVQSTALAMFPGLISANSAGNILYVSYQTNYRIQSYTVCSGGVIDTSKFQTLTLPPAFMRLDASGKVLVAILSGNQGVVSFPVDSAGNISPSGGTHLQGKSLTSIASVVR